MRRLHSLLYRIRDACQRTRALSHLTATHTGLQVHFHGLQQSSSLIVAEIVLLQLLFQRTLQLHAIIPVAGGNRGPRIATIMSVPVRGWPRRSPLAARSGASHLQTGWPEGLSKHISATAVLSPSGLDRVKGKAGRRVLGGGAMMAIESLRGREERMGRTAHGDCSCIIFCFELRLAM